MDCIPYPEYTDIAICTYDTAINFYNLPKDLGNEPSVVVMSDLDDPYCPLPINKLFLNVLNDREKVLFILYSFKLNARVLSKVAPDDLRFCKQSKLQKNKIK